MAEHEDLIQARRILAGFDAQDAYTLNEADVESCKKLLQQLIDIDAQTGGYRVSNVQGYKSSAQVTIQFKKSPGAQACADAAYAHADGADRMGLLLKKVIAHWNTNGDRLAKLEEFLRAHKALDEISDSISYEHQFSVGEAHRAALDRFQQAEEALG